MYRVPRQKPKGIRSQKLETVSSIPSSARKRSYCIPKNYLGQTLRMSLADALSSQVTDCHAMTPTTFLPPSSVSINQPNNKPTGYQLSPNPHFINWIWLQCLMNGSWKTSQLTLSLLTWIMSLCDTFWDLVVLENTANKLLQVTAKVCILQESQEDKQWVIESLFGTTNSDHGMTGKNEIKMTPTGWNEGTGTDSYWNLFLFEPYSANHSKFYTQTTSQKGYTRTWKHTHANTAQNE